MNCLLIPNLLLKCKHFMFCTQLLEVLITEDKSLAEHRGNVGKKSKAEEIRQTVLRTEYPFTNCSCFFTNNALDFHLNNQKLECIWLFFFCIWCPVFIWLPKISFSWSSCLCAKVYHCCFCAHLLRLTWHLFSCTLKSHGEKLCHILFLLKGEMLSACHPPPQNRAVSHLMLS